MINVPEEGLVAIAREKYGLWCQHGKHLYVVDPTDDNVSPRTIPADPWPCAEPNCTPEVVERELREEVQEAEASQWADFYDSQYPGGL